MKAKIFLSVLAATLSMSLCAQDFVYQGVNYTVLSASAKTVTTKAGKGSPMTSGNNNFSGDLVIPEQVTYNGEQYTVTQIGAYSFTNYPQYANCTVNVTSLSLPNTITKIGEDAFAGNGNLKALVLPESLTGETEAAAFEDCDGLETIVIPSGITHLGSYYFCASRNLKEVICYAATPPYATTGVFTNSATSTENVTLYVPSGSEEAYANYKWKETSSNPWGAWHYFGTIKSIDEWEGIEPEEPQTPEAAVPGAVYVQPGQTLDLAELFVDKTVTSYTGSDDETATVTDAGLVTGVAYGTMTVSVDIEGQDEATVVTVFVCPVITVENGSGVIYEHPVIYNSMPSLFVAAGGGYKLAGATYNGTDVDNLVNSTGYFNPSAPVTEDAVINITLAEDSSTGPATGSSDIFTSSAVRIHVNGHTVTFENVPANKAILMTDMTGKVLFDDVVTTVTVIDPGIYLVKIDGEPTTFKILVR